VDTGKPGRGGHPSPAQASRTPSPPAPEERPAEQGLGREGPSGLGGPDPSSLLGRIQDLVCLLDWRGRFLYASPSFATLLGPGAGELAERSCLDLVHPEDRPTLQRLLDEARFMRELRKADIRYVAWDGRTHLFESAVSFGPDGTAPSALVVSRDVTDRKRVEEESRLLAGFARNSPNPVLAFGADGALMYFNEAAQGVARELQKQHPREILPLNIAAIVRMCLVSGEGNLRLETSLAGRTLSWSFFPSRDGRVVHCYAEEITERIELETKLRQSQRMQSVGQVAAGVAHDFNNILTIIKGHASLLQETAPPGLALSRSIQEIAAATERAVNLTRQLLLFSRKQPAQRQLLDLDEVIKECGSMLRVLVGEPVRLHQRCASNLPAIYADAGMIQQVLINLAANARDAMPKGGDLVVSSSVAELSAAEAEQRPEASPGRFVCLSVSDTGCGIDLKTQKRVFEPFFTTKEPGKGTGLGLATVYSIAKQHEGWVELSSEPGRGATFRVYFPVASKATEPETASTENLVAGGCETVLVVEDETPLRELVVEILQQYGYRTIEAASGAHALEIWKSQAAEIDLVLTDVMMPEGVSGRDLAEKILSNNASMKVIYTSGYPMDVLGQEFFQQEGVTFLQKPYHPQTLARLVRQCLDS
jgi:two-component system, cell cycle sensor histidine kinase and response regulator CckA